MSKTTTSPLLWLPSAADGIQLTPSATAWTDGAWVELTSSAPTAMYPAYLAVLPNDGANMAQASLEIDIGTGAAGSETMIAKTRVRAMQNQWGPTSTYPLGVIYAAIQSGTRVALRVRHGLTSDTDVYRVALGYFSTLGGASGWSSSVPTVEPVGSGSALVTAGGTAWTFGSWVEVLAAASVTTNIVLTGMVPAAITAAHEIQIGTGSAGAETVKMTVPYAMSSGEGFSYVRFPRPLCVNSGTRIAVRTRSGTASATFFPFLWYVANR